MSFWDFIFYEKKQYKMTLDLIVSSSRFSENAIAFSENRIENSCENIVPRVLDTIFKAESLKKKETEFGFKNLLELTIGR